MAVKYKAHVTLNGSLTVSAGPVVEIAAPIFYLVTKKTVDLSSVNDSVVPGTGSLPRALNGLPPGILEAYVPDNSSSSSSTGISLTSSSSSFSSHSSASSGSSSTP